MRNRYDARYAGGTGKTAQMHIIDTRKKRNDQKMEPATILAALQQADRVEASASDLFNAAGAVLVRIKSGDNPIKIEYTSALSRALDTMARVFTDGD